MYVESISFIIVFIDLPEAKPATIAISSYKIVLFIDHYEKGCGRKPDLWKF